MIGLFNVSSRQVNNHMQEWPGKLSFICLRCIVYFITWVSAFFASIHKLLYPEHSSPTFRPGLARTKRGFGSRELVSIRFSEIAKFNTQLRGAQLTFPRRICRLHIRFQISWNFSASCCDSGHASSYAWRETISYLYPLRAHFATFFFIRQQNGVWRRTAPSSVAICRPILLWQIPLQPSR